MKYCKTYLLKYFFFLPKLVGFFSDSGLEISTSVALSYTKLQSCIPVYIPDVFTEGFDYISFTA